MSTPTNGVDRCECGCKYWNEPIPEIGGAHRCFDCGDRFDPRDSHDWNPDTMRCDACDCRPWGRHADLSCGAP
jgi:hypothetical protein